MKRRMKLVRLLGILTILLQNDRVTAPHLAERFEVNRQTIPLYYIDAQNKVYKRHWSMRVATSN